MMAFEVKIVKKKEKKESEIVNTKKCENKFTTKVINHLPYLILYHTFFSLCLQGQSVEPICFIVKLGSHGLGAVPSQD